MTTKQNTSETEFYDCFFVLKAYCDMDYDGGGWEVVAHTPDRAHVTGWDVGTDSGTVADFLNGWTNVKSSRAASTMISKFRGRYLYTEDQPGLPQTGTTFDTHIDFVAVRASPSLSYRAGLMQMFVNVVFAGGEC